MLSRYTMNQNSLATTLGQSHQQWTNGFVSSLKQGDFIFLLDMKFSIKYRSELTAIVRHSCFYRKTLHRFIYEMQIPAYKEHSSFRQNRQTELRILCDMHCVRMHTASLLINLSLFQSFLKMQKCSSTNFPIVTSGFTCHQGKMRARNSACLLIPASIPSYWSLTQQGNIS